MWTFTKMDQMQILGFMQISMAVILICSQISILLCFISSTILIMHKQVKCVSFNIRGLCNPGKWKLFWNYITSSQVDVICVQEHKQVEFSGQVGSFGGFDIFYAGQGTTSGVLMIIKHELNPMVAYNDQRGRWMVVQCMINGETYDFGGIYALNASRDRALLWQDICAYPWPQIAFICGDFNNSPNVGDNTSGHSHMLREEQGQ